MSDLTKCRGTIKRDDTATPFVCPWRSMCLRYLSESDERWQGWFNQAPIEWDPQTGVPGCRYRLPAIQILVPSSNQLQ